VLANNQTTNMGDASGNGGDLILVMAGAAILSGNGRDLPAETAFCATGAAGCHKYIPWIF
jgi:hypothetical protein